MDSNAFIAIFSAFAGAFVCIMAAMKKRMG